MAVQQQPSEVQMSFQFDGIEVVQAFLVTPMGPNLYRMEESSIFGEACYHDIIETEPRTDGSLRFLRVLTPSGLKTVSWILLPNEIESPLSLPYSTR